jgi:hypothetical protein
VPPPWPWKRTDGAKQQQSPAKGLATRHDHSTGHPLLAFDLKQYLTLENLKNSQGHFARLYATHRLAVIASHMAIHILATALSLPGQSMLTALA